MWRLYQKPREAARAADANEPERGMRSSVDFKGVPVNALGDVRAGRRWHVDIPTLLDRLIQQAILQDGVFCLSPRKGSIHRGNN